ncbi:hypothetical protein DBV15_08570 [Temnothorax longispinosus]|uniref:Uncharacterized protein n=1 Tax=Temnothorax longispinosus TaxID=300112 RepID=A0A4S2L4B7_9HYME|nr:hypothetical protein DBV15_08570 [Temnothorax longispinosus]
MTSAEFTTIAKTSTLQPPTPVSGSVSSNVGGRWSTSRVLRPSRRSDECLPLQPTKPIHPSASAAQRHPNTTAASHIPSEGSPGSPEPRSTPFHSLLLFGLSSFNYGRLVVEEFELL